MSSLWPLPLDPELLAQLNVRLSAEQLKQVAEAFHKVELENRYLRELLRLERIAKYGPGSERLSDAQVELLELEPGVSDAEIQAEAERAQLRLPLAKAPSAKRTGRQELRPICRESNRLLLARRNNVFAPSAAKKKR